MSAQAVPLALIVARAENGVIGLAGGMPWHLPGDLSYFKRTTLGKPVVMGRKTFESLARPLPGRPNLVITRDQSFDAAGIEVFHALETALARATELAVAAGAAEIMIIGGAEIYALALPRAGRIYLTEVHARPEGDTFFPDLAEADWREAAREAVRAEDGTPSHSYVVLERIRA